MRAINLFYFYKDSCIFMPQNSTLKQASVYDKVSIRKIKIKKYF